MGVKLLTFLFLIILSLIAISFASSEGTVTINLNATRVWWNDSVRASGVAKYSNGMGIVGTVNLTVGSDTYNCPDTSDGNWTCVFNAPTRIGDYLVKVRITNSTGSIFENSTFLTVSPSYGKIPVGTATRVVYELPLLIQDLNGEIRSVLARIIVWKG